MPVYHVVPAEVNRCQWVCTGICVWGGGQPVGRRDSGMFFLVNAQEIRGHCDC